MSHSAGLVEQLKRQRDAARAEAAKQMRVCSELVEAAERALVLLAADSGQRTKAFDIACTVCAIPLRLAIKDAKESMK